VCDDKVILFVPHFNNTLHDMMPVALRVRDQYGYQIYFAIEWAHNNETSIEECDKYGITYILVGAAQNADQEKVIKGKREQSSERRVLNFLRAFKKFPMVSQPANIIWQALYQSRMAHQARQLIKTLNPSVVVVYRDDRPCVSTFITHVANERGIPTVLFAGPIIYPYSVEARLCLGKGFTVANCGFLERLLYRSTRVIIPNMMHNWSREKVLFLPPEVALIAYFNGIFPVNPWIRGGGRARWAAVATFDDYERLIEAGISQDSIVVTGFPPFDQFDEKDQNAEREILCQKLNTPKDRFIICYCALALQKGKEAFFTVSYDEIKSRERFLVDELLNISYDIHIIFKLHPRSRSNEYDFLPVHHPRLTVIRDIDINNVIAGSNLFATYFSSAIFTAVALKKPILSFGFQNDPGYESIAGSLEGTYRARSRKEFVLAARHAINDTRSKCFGRQFKEKDPQQYYTGDGKSTIRFANLVHALSVDPKGDVVNKKRIKFNAPKAEIYSNNENFA